MIKKTARTTKSTKREETPQPVDVRFGLVVKAFARDRTVTRGGKGFGSTGLKANAKLFALISSKGRFVAKLPRKRVDELVSAGHGEYFDPGHGRLMKEWVAVNPGGADWLGLAREAHRYVSGRPSDGVDRTKSAGRLDR